MRTYTNVEQRGNKIFHRYNEDGVAKIDVVESDTFELFTKNSKGAHKSFYGDAVAPRTFETIRDAKNFVDEYKGVSGFEIFGQTDFKYQYIQNHYPHDIQPDMSVFKILNIDIETDYGDTFPYPSQAEYQIQAITIKQFGKGKMITFGLKYFDNPTPDEIEYIKCENEVDLLRRFFIYWEVEAPDIITGWNIEGFDIPYIVNRSEKILGENASNILSPLHKLIKRVRTDFNLPNGDVSYKFLGVAIVDYINIYKKYSTDKLESYSLDFVAEYELGEAKLEYEGSLKELYEKDFQTYILYNVHDVRLVEKIDNKMQFMFLAVSLSYIAKCNVADVFSPTRFWDLMVYNKLHKENVAIPFRDSYGADDEGYDGAYVKEPIPGSYNWIMSFDLTSLYPSIIREFNMSPEMMVSNGDGNTLLDKLINRTYEFPMNLIEANVTMSANGAMFKREKQGVFPALMESMFNLRKLYKKQMLDAQSVLEAMKSEKRSEYELQAQMNTVTMLDALQMAYKISLNSAYGALGNSHFRYFERDIAEGITLTGQFIIKSVLNAMNGFMNQTLKTDGIDYVIAGDTDSIMVNMSGVIEKIGLQDKDKIVEFLDLFAKRKIEVMLKDVFTDIAAYLNAFENVLHMKRESIGDRAIWRAKKNYIIRVLDNEGVRYTKPKVKIVGIEVVRSSSPRVCRNALKDAIDIILNGNESELINYVDNFHTQFKSMNYVTIASPRGISDIGKWEDPKTMWKNKTPFHVKGSILYNHLLDVNNLNQYRRIKNTDKIKLLPLKERNPWRTTTIAFHDELFPELGVIEYVDVEMQYVKTFLNPLHSLTTLVGWKTEVTNSIDDFFD